MKRIFLTGITTAAIIFFLMSVKITGEEQQLTEIKDSSEVYVPISGQNPYYLKFENDQVVIYNEDHSVYEYTDLNAEELPEDIFTELLDGKFFKNQEELYEFLETYTS